MKTFRTSITKRTMHRTQRNGEAVVLDRYILNYVDPVTHKRKTKFRKTRKEAEAAQHTIYTQLDNGTLSVMKGAPTVEQAVRHWLKSCDGRVTKHTHKGYSNVAEAYIIGPALEGAKTDKISYANTGKMPEGTKWVPMLGDTKVTDLTTAGIRCWIQTVMKLATPYTARTVKKHLSTVLAMVEEDFGVRAPRMPKRVDVQYRKKERLLIRQDEVKAILEEARKDKRCGIYYAWPFLTGSRPSEMLGLLWEDIDFERNAVHIRRTQDPDGKIKPFPKTAAGERVIPLVPVMREMLLEWRDRCPRRDGMPDRVFPSLGFETKEPGKLVKAGGPFLLCNYRNRVWRPMLRRLGLPPITPYAARHLLISNLQAEGVEIGVVSKIAGHKNPQITLKYYTHAVRDIAPSMEKLNTAYGLS